MNSNLTYSDEDQKNQSNKKFNSLNSNQEIKNQINSSSTSSSSSSSSLTEQTQINNNNNNNNNSSNSNSNSNSIDQEIFELKKTFGNVSASLGDWWEKVQKQSTQVLTTSNITSQLNTARKDLASLNLIQKAKKEVERFGEHAKEGYAIVTSEIEKGPSSNQNDQRLVNVDGIEATTYVKSLDPNNLENENSNSPKGKERAFDQDKLNQKSSSTSSNLLKNFETVTLTSFFNKLSKDSEKLTNSLQSTLSHLPSAVQAANPSRLSNSTKFDLSQVQKLAEDYLAKGEVYLQDVGNEIREIVQEAVKVIPPSENHSTQSTPSSNSHHHQSPPSYSQKRKLLDIKREALISRLRNDQSQILLNPNDESDTINNTFNEFLNSLHQSGGLEGEAWKKRIQQELELEGPDELKPMFEKLVPNLLTSELFWTRYFFRIHQIDQEEAARRVVLTAAQENIDGDFSWDMEDESEPPSPDVEFKTQKITQIDQRSNSETPTLEDLSNTKLTLSKPIHKNDSPSTLTTPKLEFDNNSKSDPTRASASGHIHTRESSEVDTADSFDVISAQQSPDEAHKNKSIKKDEEEDSDWE